MQIAAEALPWVRRGPTNKKHCMAVLRAILKQVKEAEDFKFWYSFMNKYLYPIFYHQCTCDNGVLVAELYADEQKYQC